MRWKVFLTVILVLFIAGLILTTDAGRKYSEIFGNTIGKVVSLLTKFGQPSGERFNVLLITNLDAFLGQKYKVTNSTLVISGIYNYLKIGNQDFNLKEGKRIDLTVNNIKGNFEITSAGTIVVSADSDYIEIDNLMISGNTKISAEVIPNNFLLLDLVQDKITLESVTGEITRFYDDKTGEEDLGNSKLEIYGFNGFIKMDEDGKLEMNGIATSVKGDKFDWR